VTSAARVEIHSGTQTVGDCFDFHEIGLSVLEEFELSGGESGERTARTGRSATDTRILGEEELSADDRCAVEQQERDDGRTECGPRDEASWVERASATLSLCRHVTLPSRRVGASRGGPSALPGAPTEWVWGGV
jgi:hypothetical protein